MCQACSGDVLGHVNEIRRSALFGKVVGAEEPLRIGPHCCETSAVHHQRDTLLLFACACKEHAVSCCAVTSGSAFLEGPTLDRFGSRSN